MATSATTQTRAESTRVASKSRRTLAQLMNLAGRRALVTGAAGHLGIVTCETLLELGASVTMLDQDARACQQQLDALRQRNRTAGITAQVCDLRDSEASRRITQTIIREQGGLDILIHCAGYVGTNDLPGWSVPFGQQTIEAWDTALRVNLTSAFVLVQEAHEALQQSGHSSVIFVSSIYGVVGPDWRLYEGTDMANPAAYGASKAGLVQLVRYLATLLAPSVRVNAISPGGIERGQPASFQTAYVSRTPLKRMAIEQDLKGAVAYLASDLSSYVTGHNLVVDGGWTVW